VHLDGRRYEKTVGSESFYVVVSRARHEAKLYTELGGSSADHSSGPMRWKR
jgi:hypothetical protein